MLAEERSRNVKLQAHIDQLLEDAGAIRNERDAIKNDRDAFWQNVLDRTTTLSEEDTERRMAELRATIEADAEQRLA